MVGGLGASWHNVSKSVTDKLWAFPSSKLLNSWW